MAFPFVMHHLASPELSPQSIITTRTGWIWDDNLVLVRGDEQKNINHIANLRR